jgi:arylsulfatase A-like enzyme
VQEGTTIYDVAPTLLRLLGQPIPDGLAGHAIV